MVKHELNCKSLAHFPVEVLNQITGFLDALSLTILLQICDRSLHHKLEHGGISHIFWKTPEVRIRYRTRQPTPRALILPLSLQKLKLIQSVHISTSQLHPLINISIPQSTILSWMSSLRHLSLGLTSNCNYLIQPSLIPSGKTDSQLYHSILNRCAYGVDHQTFDPWLPLAKLMPHLKSLEIQGMMQIDLPEKRIIPTICKFLAHLPTSLVELCIHSERALFILPALPPNISVFKQMFSEHSRPDIQEFGLPEPLSKNLTFLKLGTFLDVKSCHHLPAGLKTLHIKSLDNESTPFLPRGIKELKIMLYKGDRNFDPSTLPPFLTHFQSGTLFVTSTTFPEFLQKFPRTMEHLDILASSHTPLSMTCRLPLPPSLTHLKVYLHPCAYGSMNDWREMDKVVPETLKYFSFSGCNLNYTGLSRYPEISYRNNVLTHFLGEPPILITEKTWKMFPNLKVINLPNSVILESALRKMPPSIESWQVEGLDFDGGFFLNPWKKGFNFSSWMNSITSLTIQDVTRAAKEWFLSSSYYQTLYGEMTRFRCHALIAAPNHIRSFGSIFKLIDMKAQNLPRSLRKLKFRQRFEVLSLKEIRKLPSSLETFRGFFLRLSSPEDALTLLKSYTPQDKKIFCWPNSFGHLIQPLLTSKRFEPFSVAHIACNEDCFAALPPQLECLVLNSEIKLTDRMILSLPTTLQSLRIVDYQGSMSEAFYPHLHRFTNLKHLEILPRFVQKQYDLSFVPNTVTTLTFRRFADGSEFLIPIPTIETLPLNIVRLEVRKKCLAFERNLNPSFRVIIKR
jgi:hypothetical protein